MNGDSGAWKNRLYVGCSLEALQPVATLEGRWSLSAVFLFGRKSSVHTAVTA